MYDKDALDQLYESLSADLKDKLDKITPVKENLVVEKPFVIRNQTKKFPPLPKTKEKKSASSGKAETSLSNWRCDKEKNKKIENIIEELPPINCATYDVSMEEISHKMT